MTDTTVAIYLWQKKKCYLPLLNIFISWAILPEIILEGKIKILHFYIVLNCLNTTLHPEPWIYSLLHRLKKKGEQREKKQPRGSRIAYIHIYFLWSMSALFQTRIILFSKAAGAWRPGQAGVRRRRSVEDVFYPAWSSEHNRIVTNTEVLSRSCRQ